MTKQWVCIFLFTCGAAHAKAEQGCPYPMVIKYVSGYYEVSAGQLLWQSQKFEGRGLVERFIGATFTPSQGQDRENGYLDKCSYLTGDGQRVDLRYGKLRGVEAMSLTSTSYWDVASDSLGEKVYICQERSQPDNCKFTVRLPKQ